MQGKRGGGRRVTGAAKLFSSALIISDSHAVVNGLDGEDTQTVPPRSQAASRYANAACTHPLSFSKPVRASVNGSMAASYSALNSSSDR